MYRQGFCPKLTSPNTIEIAWYANEITVYLHLVFLRESKLNVPKKIFYDIVHNIEKFRLSFDNIANV